MEIAVLRFPGSHSDDDVLPVGCHGLPGARGRYAWHKDTALGPCDAVVLPGGFSYGDYLRAGAMAAHSPIMREVKAFAERGGWVLAICNGFQTACEAGLLPGILLRNQKLKFICREVSL